MMHQAGDVVWPQLRWAYPVLTVTRVQWTHQVLGSWCWLSAKVMEVTGHVLLSFTGSPRLTGGRGAVNRISRAREGKLQRASALLSSV